MMKKTVVVDVEFMRPSVKGRSRSRSRSRSVTRKGCKADDETKLDIGLILKNKQEYEDPFDDDNEDDSDDDIDDDNDNDDDTSDSGVETDNSHHRVKDTDYAVDSDEDLLQSVIDEPTFPLDVNAILSAMTRAENNTIANTSKREIDARRHEILSSLNLTPEKLADFERKLSMYRVIENPYDLKHCQLIRWIPLRSLEARPYLTLGGTLFKVREDPDDGTHTVTIRNIKRFVFNIRFEANIVFQRLSQEELLILSVVEYINSGDGGGDGGDANDLIDAFEPGATFS
jgi:hypothetical protein